MLNAGSKPKKSTIQSGSRIRKLNRKQTKLKAKKEIHSLNKLPSSFSLFRQSAVIVGRYWKNFGGILLIYLVLNTVFASGIGSISTNFESIKADLNNSSSASSGLIGFLELSLTSGTVSSATSSAFQAILMIVMSLVLIWAIRQLLTGKKVGVKESFYSSMFPLVPFVLVLAFIFIQLMPITLLSTVISAVVSSVGSLGILWSVICVLLVIATISWTLYVFASSIIALYIVTLPGTMPRDALRSAKNLVRMRRLDVIRKIVFLPVSLIIVMGSIMLPLIMYVSALVTPVFYILSTLSLLFVHVYLYNLYRRLLD